MLQSSCFPVYYWLSPSAAFNIILGWAGRLNDYGFDLKLSFLWKEINFFLSIF